MKRKYIEVLRDKKERILAGKIYREGDKLLCPVCKKEFILDENIGCVINNEYVCSPKCFLKYVKDHRKKE